MAAAALTPSGRVATGWPVYTWSAVASASWYYLWVQQGAAVPVKRWYAAAQAGCASGLGTCSVQPLDAVEEGDARWWVRTWNQYGDGPWSQGRAFEVRDPNRPFAPEPAFPDGTTNTRNPTFWWVQSGYDRVDRYQLWIDNAGVRGRVKQWLPTSAVSCDQGPYCFAAPQTNLENGASVCWLRAYNDTGASSWSDGRAFTVKAPEVGFDEQFNGSADNWTPWSGQWSIAGGKWYYIRSVANEAAYSRFKLRPYTNFDLTARLWREGCADCEHGIFFRTGDDVVAGGALKGYPRNGYGALLARDGTFAVVSMENGVGWFLSDGFVASSAIARNGAWNDLRVAMQGGGIQIHVNGQQVWSGGSAAHASGRVAVGIWGDGAGDGFWVDWAKLTPIAGTTAQPAAPPPPQPRRPWLGRAPSRLTDRLN